MSLFVISVGPLEKQEVLSGGDQVGLGSVSVDLDQGFIAYESRVVRHWTPPDASPFEPEYLVVRQPPDESVIEAMLERSGLRLLARQRLVVTDRYPDLLGIGDADFEQVLPTEFPEMLRIGPQGLADPNATTASIESDIEVYPCCGGVSAHREGCDYAD